MISTEGKLTALARIYSLYRSSTADLQSACAQKCAQCCSTDVTMTTLEAYYFWQGLDSNARDDLIRRLDTIADAPRFRPAITINHLAEICAADQEPPPEKKAGAMGRCPLLVEELCMHYEVRPFHCRCMVSTKVCRARGFAEMDDFTLTLNSVFLQVIEHLDTPGCTGNLLDVLPLILSTAGRKSYEDNCCDCPQLGIVSNRPLTKLMVPPRHQNRIAPILAQLQSIRI